MEETRRKPGRPVGTLRTIYEKPRAFRLTAHDMVRLARLAVLLETSESETVRRAIREMAKREGIE